MEFKTKSQCNLFLKKIAYQYFLITEDTMKEILRKLMMKMMIPLVNQSMYEGHHAF